MPVGGCGSMGGAMAGCGTMGGACKSMRRGDTAAPDVRGIDQGADRLRTLTCCIGTQLLF